jgi:hypothetical protein
MFEDLFAYDVDELDTAAVLTAAASSRALRERLEVLDLLHALRIADLHHEVRVAAGRGGERRRVFGGAGCPEIAEFAPVEFGAVMGMSPAAAKAYLDDAVGLRHRLPLTFARVLAFDAAVWRACKIARACRALPEQAAALVDRRVAAIVNSVTPVRLATIVDAALWEADPAAAQAAAEEQARSRGVWVKRSDDHGTKSIWVRAAAGDVIRFDATIDDIAQALRALGDTDTLDQRRAKAIGIIADPALAHELLEVAHHLAKTHTTTADNTGNTTTGNSGTGGATTDTTGGNADPVGDAVAADTDAQHHNHDKERGAASSSDDSHDHDGDGDGQEDSTRAGDRDGDGDGDRDGNGDRDRDGNGDGAGREGSAHEGDGLAGDRGDDHRGDYPPGRGHNIEECPTHNDDASGNDSPSDNRVGDRRGDHRGDGSGDHRGADAPADDWYPADQPGPNDEADRDAPHPSSSDLADPLDAPARVLAEPWRGDEGQAPDSDQDDQGGQGRQGGQGMEVFSRRLLAGKLAEIKKAAYATGIGAGGRCGPGKVIAYVHLTDETLATGQGVLRVEEHGPMIAGQLHELIGHDQVVVKPVIDLNDHISVDAYEIPERIRERVKLIYPVEQFVYGTVETTMRTDLDHVEAYDPTGPPGQTSTTNLAPLGRFSHRLKTHGDWTVRRLADGASEWLSPHGFTFWVDHTGTHPLDTEPLDTDPTDDTA